MSMGGPNFIPYPERVHLTTAFAGRKGIEWWIVSAGLHGLAVAGFVAWGGGAEQPPAPEFHVDIVMEETPSRASFGTSRAVAESIVTKPEPLEPSRTVAEVKAASPDIPVTGGRPTKTAEDRYPPQKPQPTRTVLAEPADPVDPPRETTQPRTVVVTPTAAIAIAIIEPPAPPRQRPVSPSIVPQPEQMARRLTETPSHIITEPKQTSQPPVEAPSPVIIPAAAMVTETASQTGKDGQPDEGPDTGARARIQNGTRQQAAAGHAASSPAEIDGGAGNPAPRYPYFARERGWEGRVVLRVAVDSAGSPGDVAIGRSSGRDMLDRAAMAAVRKWRFRPASRAGRPVAGVVEVPISFRLRNDN